MLKGSVQSMAERDSNQSEELEPYIGRIGPRAQHQPSRQESFQDPCSSPQYSLICCYFCHQDLHIGVETDFFALDAHTIDASASEWSFYLESACFQDIAAALPTPNFPVTVFL